MEDSSGIGLHSRYYPGEIPFAKCKSFFTGAKNAKFEDKRKVFDTICEHTSPVFRFFFVEKFGHSLEAWYESKLRYTRSVAVSSMVGHILGIGKLLLLLAQ